MRRLLLICGCVALIAGVARAQAPPGAPAPGTAQATQGPPIPDTNPFSTEADIQQGSALFQTHCTYCHGASGEGGRGADLTAGIYSHGGRDPELYSAIRNGIP